MTSRTALRHLAPVLALAGIGLAADPKPSAATAVSLIGYSELRTDLKGGRHANVRTMRAAVVEADGTTAVVGVGWQSPENASWEEEHRTFRMDEGRWKLDSCLLDLATGKAVNVTAVDRVSHHNAGLFFLPGGKGLGFTALVNGVSKPHLMDPDGRNKRDVAGRGAGFAYGFNASPGGKSVCYHENYQVYVSAADGSGKKRIGTGHPFASCPRGRRTASGCCS